ncbi:glutamine amidotransferase-related protein [Leifsonia flava]|uniref:Glutamine amidotransferase n=1 Tax=Orlajensenia leifsoniae TaxID=2561933 RepID=A0A4Y9R1G3_9MICO|nr:gamma-glutamyl-gamma-aminobutyrate hydrolase family protein [Leifsonia flava]TFV98048.1 glutamine amidotransferase [Leifsonia flava]
MTGLVQGSALTTRTALVLRHDAGIGLGNLGPVLVEHGYEVQIVDTPAADLSAIDPSAADLVVVLGGDEGAYEGAVHPFIDAEIALLRERIAAERPIFGVCLGAQLLAESLGGSAYKGPTTEVGYLEIVPTDAGDSSPVRHFRGVPVVQWHGDTYDLPEGITTLATSGQYAHQAFAIDEWLLAVQFHPEVTAEMHEDWVQRWGGELPEHGLTADGLRADRARYSDDMQRASRALLGEYLDGLTVAEASSRSEHVSAL